MFKKFKRWWRARRAVRALISEIRQHGQVMQFDMKSFSDQEIIALGMEIGRQIIMAQSMIFQGALPPNAVHVRVTETPMGKTPLH